MLSSSYKVRGEEVARLKQTSIKVLILLFINTTVWLAGTFIFMHLEASNEAEHKCGVKKVQRNFIETLWQESRTSDELEWKSSARQKIMNFEDQIYEAVEAGVSSTSGQSQKLLSLMIIRLKIFHLRSEGVEHTKYLCLRLHHVHHNRLWSSHPW